MISALVYNNSNRNNSKGGSTGSTKGDSILTIVRNSKSNSILTIVKVIVY